MKLDPDNYRTYSDVVVVLIDALRDFINCCERDLNDAVCDGVITPVEASAHTADLLPFKEMLVDLLRIEVDGWPRGSTP